MRFLLDVHISTSIAKALADQHEVTRAALAYPTWSDTALLRLAVDQRMIVVTEDSDFSDLVYAHSLPSPPAIIYIRCDPAEQANMAERIIEVVAAGRLMGHMAVIKRSTVRYRPLPNSGVDNA